MVTDSEVCPLGSIIFTQVQNTSVILNRFVKEMHYMNLNVDDLKQFFLSLL